MPGFDPLRLGPSASVNRVRIMDLPGAPFPDIVRGRTAYDLLSSAATAARVRQHASNLGLAQAIHTPDALLLRLFSCCFEAPDQTVREAADWIAEVSGKALAGLAATLRLGDEINRAARPEWDDDVWAHWATVKRVYLGGGLASGRFGEVMVKAARVRLPKLGVRDVQLERQGIVVGKVLVVQTGSDSEDKAVNARYEVSAESWESVRRKIGIEL